LTIGLNSNFGISKDFGVTVISLFIGVNLKFENELDFVTGGMYFYRIGLLLISSGITLIMLSLLFIFFSAWPLIPGTELDCGWNALSKSLVVIFRSCTFVFF